MKDHWPIGGIHSVRAALKFGPEGVAALWVDPRRQDRRLDELIELARGQRIEVQRQEAAVLDRQAGSLRHQGVIAWVRVPAARDERVLPDLLDAQTGPAFLLVLDGVQDPHNLGACLRTADAVGVQAVIAPRDRAVGLTPVVCKVASGAAATLPYVQVTNLSRTLELLKARGIWLNGLAGDATASLFETDLGGPLALVLGAEGQGLRRLTRERCDRLARLPLCGQVESLNVSVAAGVALYEALRQRGGCPPA